MALKKSQLYSSLWQSCDELRGGMDASQYKDYVLTLLFMKYVSDRYAGRPDAIIVVPDGGGFADMVKRKGDKEIGDRINQIIGNLAEANDLKGVIDQADFNDSAKLGAGKEMQDRLSKLVAIFEGLDLSANRAESDDLLGDAYEYLMRHFATESGKSKGQFYTPAEVSRIMAKVIGFGPDTRPDQTLYDPTRGSGSLLLKAADEAPNGITVYGQEMDNATWALARMNMFLHGHPTAELWRGNTLAAPYFKNPDGGLRTFDFAVANPPFSAKAWSNGLDPGHDEFRRFENGIPPARNGDYAFLLHLIASLRSKGKGAIILPPQRAVSRQPGGRHSPEPRPARPPQGHHRPAPQPLLRHRHSRLHSGHRQGERGRPCRHLHDRCQSRLREGRQQEPPPRAGHPPDRGRVQPPARSAALLPSGPGGRDREPRQRLQLEPPALYRFERARGPARPRGSPQGRHSRPRHRRPGPLLEGLSVTASGAVRGRRPGGLQRSPGRGAAGQGDDPRTTATSSCYRERIGAIFDGWRETHEPFLKAMEAESTPKDIIHRLSEDLLVRFDDLPLLDPYDLYQRLMDYWDETMQDDVYLIVADGWIDASRPRGVIEDKDRKIKEAPDLTIGRRKYKMDLIPPVLVVARYFGREQAVMDELRRRHEGAAGELAAFVDEHTGEGGLLESILNDRGKVTRGAVQGRLDAIRDEDDPESGEERDALARCLALLEDESALAKTVRTVQARLDEQVLDHYAALTEPEIKTLVVEDKWLASTRTAIEDELQRVTQRLAGRVRVLEERYARPLPKLEEDVAKFSAKVEDHLKRMGLPP